MNQKSKKVLSDDDVFCPVCRCILIKPVTAPCSHSVCLLCFDNTLKENALQCVKCKKRFASWVRNARKKNSLINEPFWAQIQAQYAVEVGKRQRGEDDGLEERIIGAPSIKICQQGEVGKEFKQQLEKLQEQERRKKEKEELENAAIAQKFQQEEEERAAAEMKRKEMIALRDLELAKKMAAEANQAANKPEESIILNGAACSTPKPKKVQNKSLLLQNSSPTWIQEKIVGPLDNFVRSLEKKNTNTNSYQNDYLDTTVPVDEQFKPVELNVALKRPLTEYMKLYYSERSSNETSPVSGSSKDESNQFRPIRPSPLTPTKDTSAIVRTIKPSVCRSFFAEKNSVSPSNPSMMPFNFATSSKCAFAPTCSSDKTNAVTDHSNDSNDSETDFEDNSDENGPSIDFSTSTSALKQLEDDIVKSYCSSGGEDLNSPSLVNKLTNRLQPAENQLNKISLSPFTREKRECQILTDYELALKLQEDFDKQREKENLAFRQAMANSYELRKRPEKPTKELGNCSKKRKLNSNSKESTKQQTLDAFKFKSSRYQ